MPSVTVPCRPSGEPTATTCWPTTRLDDDPSAMGVRPKPASATTLSSGGSEIVSSGGTANATVIGSGATQVVLDQVAGPVGEALHDILRLEAGWPAYGGEEGGTRYSPNTQITPANVHELQMAWTYRTGDLGQGSKDWERSAFESTPILYDGALYFTTSSTDVIALDAATGRLRWRHASGSRKELHYSDGVSRGVSLWVDFGRLIGVTCVLKGIGDTPAREN